MRYFRPDRNVALAFLLGALCMLLFMGDWRAIVKIAEAQVPFGAFRIMDGTHTQLARVNHTGQLAVDATVTVTTDNVNVFHQSTVAHVSSVTHVAVMSVAGTALGLGAGLPIGHVGSVVHVAASGLGTPTQAMSIRCVNTGATAFESCGGTVTSDTVNVFHQSTVRHISSVTHIASAGLAIANQALAVRCVDTGGTTFQACGGGSDPASVVQSSAWTIQALHQAVVSHISSVVHVASYGVLHIQGRGTPGDSHGGVLTIQGITGMNAVVVSQATASSLQITATQTGTWTVQPGNTPNTTAWLVNAGHTSSVTHVAGSVRLMSGTPNNQLAIVTHFGALAVTCYTAAGATESCGGTGGSGDAVNVFHQSTVRHVSSVTHVTGYGAFHIQGLGTPGQSHGGVLSIQGVNNGNAVSVGQSLASWNIAHVSSITHVRGSMQIVATYGQAAFLTHFGALAVTCYTNAGVAESCAGTSTPDAVNVFHQSTIRHISSLTHVVVVDWQRWAHMQVSQSGSWTVQATHQGGEWNVRHVTSVTHVQGSMQITATYGQRAFLTHFGALAVTCYTNAGVAESCAGTSTPDAVNVFHQSTIAHVSSVTHVALAGHAVIRVMGAHVTGSIHVAGLTNVGSGAPGTGTTQMVCHSTLAIHVAAAAPGYTQIIHLTSSNGGINQAQWRIYICSIMVVSAHAQGFSLLEGVGTTCMGQPRHALIGAWRPDDSVVMAANGGFSISSPFPVLSTQVPGNNLCIAQTTRTSGGSISGTMSYRAGP